MKTDFLKSLGITEQSTIDAIMAENGRDVNAARGESTTLQTRVEDLETQLAERDQQLEDLKSNVTNNEALTARIEELETENSNTQAAYRERIAAIEKTHAIESAVRDAKAKNTKAVIALLDQEKITMKDGQLIGISEQLKALSESEDSSFLFGETASIAGATPNDKPGEGDNGGGGIPREQITLSTGIANFFNTNK